MSLIDLFAIFAAIILGMFVLGLCLRGIWGNLIDDDIPVWVLRYLFIVGLSGDLSAIEVEEYAKKKRQKK